MSPAFVITLLAAFSPYLPSPHDTDGLGLRIRLHREGLFLERESITEVPIDVVLINFSKEIREHDPFIVALKSGDLRLRITGPNDKLLRAGGWPFLPRDPFTVMNKLRPGQCFGDTFFVASFGSRSPDATGRYQLVATLKVGGKELTSPPVEFEMVKVPDDAVLVSRNVPIAGEWLKLPDAAEHRAAVEQVRVGDQVWLVYRRFVKGGVFYAKFVAKLPGKCGMAVEGTYGEWGPIRITYKTSPTAEPTKLAIQSSDGMPWTESNERTWQEKLRAKNGLPPTKPPPRPIKP